ncbi:aminotransferase-like domain-containing protein [Saccharibacillus endophyticus]|uniref:HTH-type transcriptional regulator YisV n=1 Tax=Saccharibacillus endophyticus TaxID=2060666 RepID=A0ABQ2A5G6_9BACL|nr:PLP-dependent aminotransferase family protein [Saccharibacillus endophyticus]GGH86461.1 putative HTH-type transcriptional regulator YisV [Saccharibacillus endophyticus]
MDWKLSSRPHHTLQAQIVARITERIEHGDWAAGTRLPAQRELAMRFGVNRSTVQAALDELKADGLLETRQGSGAYVSGSAWNALLARSQPNWQRHIRASVHRPNRHTIRLINESEPDPSFIRLGTGELSPELLPAEQLQRSLHDLKLDARTLGYSEPLGSLRLRSAVRTRLEGLGIHAQPDNICIVSGALQALQLISVGLLEDGSTVFHESASYLNSVHPFQSAGMRMLTFRPGSDVQERLARAGRGRQSLLYAVPALNNPTGRSWNEKERKTVYDACSDLRIPIVEDDVYRDLLFAPGLPPIKASDSSGQVLYLGSLSKSLSPGLRIGWIVAPSPVIARLADVKMQTDYGSSAFSQEIAAHWLESGLYAHHAEQLRSKLQARASFAEQALHDRLGEFADWQTPEGGFYIWLRFLHPIVNKGFFRRLLDRKVLINPGYIYAPDDLHHIRFSCAYASQEEMISGLDILREEVIRSLSNPNR